MAAFAVCRLAVPVFLALCLALPVSAAPRYLPPSRPPPEHKLTRHRSLLLARDYDDVDLPNGAAGPYSEGGYKPPDARASLITAGVFGFLALVGVALFFVLWVRLRRENAKEQAILSELRSPESPDDSARKESEPEKPAGWWRTNVLPLVSGRSKPAPQQETRAFDAECKHSPHVSVNITPLNARVPPALATPVPPPRAVTVAGPSSITTDAPSPPPLPGAVAAAAESSQATTDGPSPHAL